MAGMRLKAQSMKISIMRHGATTYNEQHLYAGSIDVPLSAAGEAQAVEAGVCPQVKKVYVSSSARAQRTADLCFPNALQVMCDGLQEMDFGDFEGRSASDMADDGAYRSWVDSMCTTQCPGGEDRAALIERTRNAIERIVRQAQRAGEHHVVVVGHGGTIMAAMTAFCDGDHDYFEWQTGNCQGYTADVSVRDDQLVFSNPQHFANLSFLLESFQGEDAAQDGDSWRAPESFFQNRACAYFPCHEGVREDEFNCLFCFCPLYALGPECEGNFTYTRKGRKNCRTCALPHIRDNGMKLVKAHYEELAQLASRDPEDIMTTEEVEASTFEEDFDPVTYINSPRWQESRLGLDRIAVLLDRMGRPQDRLKFVHVAGTNGKGSVCSYIAAAMQVAGYRTGLFTSPYILQFEERIRVDGENIPAADLRDVTLFVRGHAEALAAETGEHPTEFELMCTVAFEHFARSGCDVVVCEVGLGGRYDATNVIAAPEVCVITRLGYDHTELLGDTLAAIAGEKAGIVKPGAPVVSWPQEDGDAMRVIEQVARENGCTLIVPDFAQLRSGQVESAARPFTYAEQGFTTRLLATCQPQNAALAIEALRVLRQHGWNVSDDAIREGIAQTRWPGRFEVFDHQGTTMIVDGAHNPQGVAVLADSLRDVFPNQRMTFVISVLSDKDFHPMVREMVPIAKAFVCATPPNPRALAAADLAHVIRDEVLRAGLDESDVPVVTADGYAEALHKAFTLREGEGPVCAFGSLYAIGSIKAALEA
jgi:dihydrofolate synthase/folylpolyglutamate synthase